MIDSMTRMLVTAGLLAIAGVLAGCSGKSDSERIEALRKEGNTAALKKEVESPDAGVSREAVRALARVGPEARPQLEEAMKDARSEIRTEAALAYPRAAPGTAAPQVAQLARTDPVPSVRAAAVTSLGYMRAMDEMETVITALEDPDPLVRQRASEAVGRIMGFRLNVNGTPEQHREAANMVRKVWERDHQMVRDYYKPKQSPRTPAAPTK